MALANAVLRKIHQSNSVMGRSDTGETIPDFPSAHSPQPLLLLAREVSS